MKLIMENWRKHLNELKEGAVPHSAHHVVKKMMKTGKSAKETLKSLTTDLSDEEADRWLERHKDEMDSAKKELGEGLGKLAGTAALGMALGAGTPAQAGDTDTSSDTSTTQQADVKVQTNTLVKNDDGSVSVTIPIGPMTQLLDNPMFASNFVSASRNIARGALAMAVKGQAVKAGVKVGKGNIYGSSYTYLDKDGSETTGNKAGAPVYITITGFVK